MKRYFVLAALGALLAGGIYHLGKVHAEAEYLKKETKAVKNAGRKRARIAAEPHAGRDDLLELMRRGVL